MSTSFDLDDDYSQLLLRAMRPTNVYEETISRLLQSIRLGLIRPGERFPSERELANMLKVSRDTVREAISSLVEQGFIVSKRGRYGGTFVVENLPDSKTFVTGNDAIGKEEILDLIVLRKVLEIGTVRIAATTDLSAAARRLLADTLNESIEAKPEQYRRLDSRLHLLLAELTGSSSLVQLMADMRTRFNVILESLPLLPVNLSNSNEQHRAIVDAILSGKPDEAANVMKEHLSGSEALLRAYLLTLS